jgi:uncharacterized phage protein (TIGR02218 family)
VNWANPEDRALTFRGTIGEIARAGGAFQAELRGLTEVLNQPQGRAFQRSCAAVLGDAGCKFNLLQQGFTQTVVVVEVTQNRAFRFVGLPGVAPRWFDSGRLTVISGAAVGLVGVIKADRDVQGQREVEVWQQIPAAVVVGDTLRLEAGCDKRAETCRLKFANFANFRGFPDIPGEDWLASYPVSSQVNRGGSLVR